MRPENENEESRAEVGLVPSEGIEVVFDSREQQELVAIGPPR